MLLIETKHFMLLLDNYLGIFDLTLEVGLEIPSLIIYCLKGPEEIRGLLPPRLNYASNSRRQSLVPGATKV